MAISLKELLLKQFPPENHLVGSGLLDYNSYLFVAGPPKTYKSFLTATLGINLASGSPLFGATHKGKHGEDIPSFTVRKQCRVLILEQEVGEMDMQTRLGNMMGGLCGADQQACRDNIFIHSCDHKMRLDSDEGRDYIARIIDPIKPDVVIFDPLKEFHCADENSSKEMGLVFARLDTLKAHYKFACVLSHHTRKSFDGRDDDDPEAMRGSSQIFGKGDTYMMVRSAHGKRTGEVKVSFTLRRGKPLTPMGLLLEPLTCLMKFNGWGTGRKGRKDSDDDDNTKGHIVIN